MLDGDLGVIVVIAFPQATNWTLAFVADFAVCCAPMLTVANNFVRLGALAFHCSSLHVLTLAQLLAQSQAGICENSQNACK